MKKIITETFQIVKKIISNKIEKIFGIKCNEHSRIPLLLAVLFCIFLFSGSIYKSFTYLINHFYKIDNSVDQTASVLSYNSNLGNTDFVNEVASSTPGCDFTKSNWKIWLGDFDKSIIEENNFYLLSLKHNQALFKFGSKINRNTECIFKFIPDGDESINYVISFDGGYQIVIGDNDYWTISLSATDVENGPLYPIKEIGTEKTRPRLSSKIKKGTIVTVKLSQNMLENNKYKVSINVDYRPDIDNMNDNENDRFEWMFSPSPAIDLGEMELSVGLIRAKNTKTYIGASFVYPDPSLNIVK